MHATEWAGGVAALHFVHKLLAAYGSDERVTRLLDTRTIYVLPRMTPDGVEATLEQGRFIRSVDRPYPTALPEPGIIPRDVNGDGRTVFMRFRDPNGPWKEYARDQRLLVPRAPDETGGELLAGAAGGRRSRATTASRSPTSPSTRRSISAPTSRPISGQTRQPDRRPVPDVGARDRGLRRARSRTAPTSSRTSPATPSAASC